MDTTYWFKQANEPLFPEIDWSKPERRDQAGKILIVGGSKQSFARPAKAYQDSLEAGVGRARLILPSSLSKLPVLKQTPDLTFATSTKNGALGQESWAEIQAGIDWADMVVLPGDLGHNYETIQLIGKLIHSPSPLALDKEVVELLSEELHVLIGREDTLLSLDPKSLQRLAKSLHFDKPFTRSLSLVNFVDNLHELTSGYAACLICEHNEQVIVAKNGRISTTKPSAETMDFIKASVYCLQNPGKYFEAATASLFTGR